MRSSSLRGKLEQYWKIKKPGYEFSKVGWRHFRNYSHFAYGKNGPLSSGDANLLNLFSTSMPQDVASRD
jgi:hypothetical protein